MGSATSTRRLDATEGAADRPPVDASSLQVDVKVFHCSSSRTRFSSFSIKPSGVVIQGSNAKSSLDIGQAYANATCTSLQRYELTDARACQLLVVSHKDSFWAVPAPEAFSRHSGTCRMLGDRNHPPSLHTLGCGDVLRVGSVGLVVTEVHTGGQLEALKDSTIDKLVRDTAMVVEKEDSKPSSKSSPGSGVPTDESDGTSGESDSKMCYMCFDDEQTTANPLISPCKCTGDTQWVHVECLRKWHRTGNESDVCKVTSVTASCSVCKTSYRSTVPLPGGKTAEIFNETLKPPYISFLVVTKHDMAKSLFNTRFQLSFSTVLKPDGQNSTRDLHIGRSSTSDMMLDYRTVSAHHAAVRFKNGQFLFQDSSSSNGSYLYLRKPVELKLGTTTNLRLGRSLLSLRVTQKSYKRIVRSISTSLSRKLSRSASSEDAPPGSGSVDPGLHRSDSYVSSPYLNEGGSLDGSGPDAALSFPSPPVVLPNSPGHFELIHNLARPTATLEYSPTHASGRRGSGQQESKEGSSSFGSNSDVAEDDDDDGTGGNDDGVPLGDDDEAVVQTPTPQLSLPPGGVRRDTTIMMSPFASPAPAVGEGDDESEGGDDDDDEGDDVRPRVDNTLVLAPSPLQRGLEGMEIDEGDGSMVGGGDGSGGEGGVARSPTFGIILPEAGAMKVMFPDLMEAFEGDDEITKYEEGGVGDGSSRVDGGP